MTNNERFNLTINPQQQQQLQWAMELLIGLGNHFDNTLSDEDIKGWKSLHEMLNNMEPHKLGSHPINNNFNL